MRKQLCPTLIIMVSLAITGCSIKNWLNVDIIYYEIEYTIENQHFCHMENMSGKKRFETKNIADAWFAIESDNNAVYKCLLRDGPSVRISFDFTADSDTSFFEEGKRYNTSFVIRIPEFTSNTSNSSFYYEQADWAHKTIDNNGWCEFHKSQDSDIAYFVLFEAYLTLYNQREETEVSSHTDTIKLTKGKLSIHNKMLPRFYTLESKYDYRELNQYVK